MAKLPPDVRKERMEAVKAIEEERLTAYSEKQTRTELAKVEAKAEAEAAAASASTSG